MRVLNAVQRIIMLLLLIPVVVICLNALLRTLNAQEDNAIVSAVREARDTFVLPIFKTVFAGRNPLQDEIVTLAAIAVVALAVIFLFRFLRSLAGTKAPKQRSAPAAKPKKTVETEKTVEKAPAKPAADKTETSAPTSAQTQAPAPKSEAPASKTEAPVTTGAAGNDDETHSSSST